ncbi:hypothetical protein [Variovorax sp. W6]|uniref:hypothetical protein n=1 Tax=Variovorax sp. W6 TaxID=3093895 RepID=UPI003D8069A2
MRDKYIFEPTGAPPIPGSHLAYMCGLVASYFSGQKGARKSAAETASKALQKAMSEKNGQSDFSYVKKHQIAFEEKYLSIGTATIDQLVGNLKERVLSDYRDRYWPFSWAQHNAPRPALDSIGALTHTPTGTNSWNILVQARTTVGTAVAPVVIGNVYRGNDRFELLTPQPPDVVNTIYVKRTKPHQHYIGYQRDGAQHFIRRYVARGLNQDDSLQLATNSALRAAGSGTSASDLEIRKEGANGRHDVEEGSVLSLDQQILSHTRGWYKRFISATTTSRTVYSTRGEEFRSVFGKVLIDLAFVPGQNIYDLHTPDALHHFSTTADALLTPFSSTHQNAAQRELAEEQHLAARDVIRTREVLIRASVPLAAIRFKDLGKKVVAISHPGTDENGSATFKAVEGAWKTQGLTGWLDEETLSYRRNQRWYKFYLFASAAEATRRFDAVPDTYKDFKETRSFFEFPDTQPVGFAR